MVSLGLGLGDGGVHLRNCRNGVSVATGPVGRSQTMLTDAKVMEACSEDQRLLYFLSSFLVLARSENGMSRGVVEIGSPSFHVPTTKYFQRSAVAQTVER